MKGPGAGKGTQCEKLSKDFGMIHLSAGELLRNERLKDTENGKLIDSYLKDGRIVPVEISLQLLKNEIESIPNNRYLIDGFPRNWDNLIGWEKIMDHMYNVEMILYVNCDENILEERLLTRGLTSGRTDDNIITAKKRFKTFKDETIPVINHFQSINKYNLVTINGNQDIELVYQFIKNTFIPFIAKEIIDVTQELINYMNLKQFDNYNKLCDSRFTNAINDYNVSNISFMIQKISCY